MSNIPTLSMKRRLKYVVVVAVVLAFCVLVGSLVNISVLNYDVYTGYANRNQLRPTTIAPTRGTIYDRNMGILAQSATVWDVIMSPVSINSEEKDGGKQKQLLVQGLSDLLELDPEAVMEKANKKNQYQIIKSKIEKEDADRVREFLNENKLNGIISLVESTKRYYPNSTMAASTIGFVGSDSQGLYGLELKYDKELSGTPGYVVSLKDGHSGNDMPDKSETRYDPVNGNSLVLTLDETIQHFLEKALNRAIIQHKPDKGVCGIVMNVNTGEVLAMANLPSFDLNQPYTLYDEAEKARIAELPEEEQKEATSAAILNQRINKSISYTYQPGSTFKTMVASAALEEGVCNENSSFFCPGYVQVEDRKMKCHIGIPGHGTQNFRMALVNSCNPAFVDIGKRLGPDLFFKYFQAFGLTQRTGIDLPGEGDSSYYNASQLGTVSLASSSFGQSNAITPIQLVTAVSAVVNGGYVVTPHLVKDILDENGNVIYSTPTEVKRQAISEETSALMRDMMESVVTEKTGSNAYVKGYRTGGKSGTSQKQNPGDKEGVYISSYIGVAPIDDPEIAVYVMIDESTSGDIYGSVVAAPVVTSVMSDVLPYLGFTPKYTAEDLETMNTTMPLLTGRGVLEAESKLSAVGLGKPKIIGDGATVVKQVPSVGSPIPKDGMVILYTEDAEEEMVSIPDVIGLKPALAQSRLEKLNLNVVINGSDDPVYAKITEQNIAKDTQVPIGTVIELTSVRSDTD